MEALSLVVLRGPKLGLSLAGVPHSVSWRWPGSRAAVPLLWASRDRGLPELPSVSDSEKKTQAFYEWEDPLCCATPSLAWSICGNETIAPQLQKETDFISEPRIVVAFLLPSQPLVGLRKSAEPLQSKEEASSPWKRSRWWPNAPQTPPSPK